MGTITRRTQRGAVAERRPVNDIEVVTTAPAGFFSFSWSYTELTARDGRTRVKARRVRLDDGRLSQESFEGEAGAEAFDAAARSARAQLQALAGAWLAPLAWLLPAARRDDQD